jgi:cytochrome c heme-lyase
MFYNALARKNKLDDETSEEDMASVVAVHNHMNEQTWVQILQYERTLQGRGPHQNEEESSTTTPPPPKLLKFQGRPQDLSPKAALKHYVCGHPLPFDRHDWYIERHDGAIVRYVLDYYAGADHSLHVDVRPALDNPRALYDRTLSMPLAQWRHATDFTPLPLFPNDVLKAQYDESKDIWQNIIHGGGSGSAGTAAPTPNPTTTTVANLLQTECRAAAAAVSACNDESACQKTAIDLTLCLGQRLCPTEYTALQRSTTTTTDNDDDDGIPAALQRLQACVDQQPSK